jgi:hypothetical protein
MKRKYEKYINNKKAQGKYINKFIINSDIENNNNKEKNYISKYININNII